MRLWPSGLGKVVQSLLFLVGFLEVVCIFMCNSFQAAELALSFGSSSSLVYFPTVPLPAVDKLVSLTTIFPMLANPLRILQFTIST